MKKYVVSILVTSIFLLGAPFLVPKALAVDLNIRDFINLLVAIGVITPDKLSTVNTFLVAQNLTPVSLPSLPNYVACPTKDVTQCPDGSYVSRTGPNCEFMCPEITKPFVTILSPDGGEVYKKESKITVNWQTKNVPSSFKFDVIRLRDYLNGGEYNLAKNVRNDGREIIALKNIPEGVYTLEIKAYLDDVLVMDSSDSYFKIISSDNVSLYPYPKLDLLNPEIDEYTVSQNGVVYPVSGQIDTTWCKNSNPNAVGDGPFEFSWGDLDSRSCSWFPATHTYTVGGKYQIEVRVKNTAGLISSRLNTVGVFPK